MKIRDNILCIKTHSKGVVVKGETYPLIGIRESPCDGHLQYNIGIEDWTGELNIPMRDGQLFYCLDCGKTHFWDGVYWLHYSLFGISASYPSAISEILKQEIVEEKSDCPKIEK